jgi:pimeloyl-ACP methyl ester carboxylesterase
MATQDTATSTQLRHVTPARVIAVVVIALLAVGLALVTSGGSSTVKVPRGAHAGSVVLHKCSYSTEKGKYAADCGTLVVPENRQNPSSRLIALPIIRVRAKTASGAAPVFYMQGGPGITNMTFPMANRYAADRDVVIVGYRGVDGSVKLDCPEVASALTGTSDLLAQKTLRAYSAAYTNCAHRLTKKGVDLLGYNSVERVDDFEAARTALGYKTVDLISESAGTRTAMIYSWRYPRSIERSVMLGVNPPGHYLYDGPTTDAQIQHYSDLCATDTHCRAQTANLANTMRTEARHLPKRWMFLPIKSGNVKLATFYGMMHATSAATPLSSPQTIDTWTRAAHGDASGMWLLSVVADMTIPQSHVWGDVAATGQLDRDVAAAYYANGGDHGSILGNPFTDSLWSGPGLMGAWPQSTEVNQYRTLRPSDTSTLLISGDVDFATPAEFATKQYLPTLSNGHQVILHNLGHTADTWNYQKPALDRLINTFLASGRVDQSGYTPRTMSFDASPTHSRIAWIVLASLVGLGAVMVGLLVWLPLRLRRRGSVGTKTGFATRVVYAPVLGLGGFSIATLLAVTVWPSLFPAYEPLTIVAIGAPVALAVYLAWVRRTWSRQIRNAGLCTAVGGAALGTWLGLHSVSGLFSAILGVVGAVLGANLALLVRDMASGTPTAPAPAAGDDRPPAPAEVIPAGAR